MERYGQRSRSESIKYRVRSVFSQLIIFFRPNTSKKRTRARVELSLNTNEFSVVEGKFSSGIKEKNVYRDEDRLLGGGGFEIGAGIV